MATLPTVAIVSAFDVTTSFQDAYEVPGSLARVGIDAIVLNNYSSSNVNYSMRIVQSGISTNLNEIITEKEVRAKGNDLAPSMTGQSIGTGGIIQVKASANSSINLTITATAISV